MTASGAILISGAAIVGGLLIDMFKDDLRAILLRGLDRLVRMNAELFLPSRHAEQVIAWYECDVEEMKAFGGTGISVGLMFVFVVGPNYTWEYYRQKTPKA